MDRIRKVNLAERWGMYPEQFELLGQGDVIKDIRGNLRIIEKTSPSHIQKDQKKTYTIYLTKLRPSWTNGRLTAVSRGDSAKFRPVKVANKKIWLWDRERVLRIRRINGLQNVEALQKKLNDRANKYKLTPMTKIPSVNV